jgi:hypothetical protein
LEAIAYQVRDVFDVMQAESGAPLQTLLADGGASRNDLLMQFQADIINCPVLRSTSTEISPLGAAFLAGLAMGLWADEAEIEACAAARPFRAADVCRTTGGTVRGLARGGRSYDILALYVIFLSWKEEIMARLDELRLMTRVARSTMNRDYGSRKLPKVCNFPNPAFPGCLNVRSRSKLYGSR